MLLPQHINAPELVELPLLALHRVFDDLPRTSILAIASLRIPHLDDSILTHRTHRRSFPDAAALAAARDWYLLADTIRALAPTPPACQSVWTTINHPSGYNPSAVHASIVHLIDSLSPPSPSYYAQFTPASSNIWDSSTLPLARARLTTVLRNGQRLQSEKLAQLRRISAIYDAHPTYVKKKLDPHQAPRAQPPPLLQRLRRQVHMLEQPFWAHRLDRGHGDVKVWSGLGRWVPVPLDRHLGMLLKVLERYPLPDEAMPGVTLAGDGSARKRVRMVPVAPEYLSAGEEYTEIHSAAADGGTKKIKYLLRPARTHTHVYPASTVRSIRTALLGLKHTYAIPGAAPRARTLYTPYSAREHQSARRALQPRFVQAVENEPHAFAVSWREIEWLEAFLACCEYMAAMQERWGGGLTVAQWWEGKGGLCECKGPDI